MVLSKEQVERYKRNIAIVDLGVAGQERLLASEVLVIGAGGLGSPAAYYLAAAGVGRIGVADPDAVELSNLQRQIIHSTRDLGRAKAESARDKMLALNPEIEVDVHNVRATGDNILDLIAPYDFVIDATDSFASKYLINDACAQAEKPFSFGGVLGFSGQTMTVLPKETACLRCAMREPPPTDGAPSSVSAGILGAVAGILGAIQAAEAIKHLIGAGENLTNSLLSFDAREMRFKRTAIARDPSCPACGSSPTLTALKPRER